MSDRASIRGQGASIFFDEDPARTPAAPGRDQALDGLPDEAKTRANRDVATSGRQEARGPSNAQASESDRDDVREFFRALTLPAALRRRLRATFREEHRFHTTIRLSREDMAALRDACYELDARLGLTVNRNDIGRLALRLILEDYALRKKESLLVQVLNEDDQT